MTGDGGDVGAGLLDTAGLHGLVDVLRERGYRVIGPTLRDNAIVLAELQSASELPRGWGVEVAPGHYRVRRRDDDAAFGHSAGPQSWKQFLHPPRQRMWAGTRDGSAVSEPEEPPRYAFLGVRGCDLAAIATLDRVLGRGDYPDNSFVSRRRQIFVVAVNCTEPGGLCFCASMGTGPAAGPGYDLVLTERAGGDGEASYVVEVGTPEGADVLAALPHRAATDDETRCAQADVANAAHKMGRQMPEGDLRNLLIDARESPRWDEVASRCLTCGNCTMVCPTCFCTSTEDITDLTGDHAERWRQWASCFEFDFTFIHGGGSVRQSGASRYRHWMTHKLATWHDQFGMSGCVGCGRCIAWCPTGIDITAEMNKIAGDE
ncbi:4Fe-4S dicluster domain-containing protein [Mycobacterium sp.]|uniref:4Fe-4S dicluster domain-containing protein n=1 Tax=Mycobacterium sp. TaxID=1785 RepID=UPI000CB68A0F|nr:4Fe-4S dicluster domain-containing protein [Mycobacterium sp.]MBX9982658.1 4Fe-4S dicluster domain-containing protein [Mycobacterium gordonae]PJE13846.1 MAG: 4Fe-4S ferredoxin [Mycobacterium sp.]